MSTFQKALRICTVLLGLVVVGLLGWHLVAGHKHHHHREALRPSQPLEGLDKIPDFTLTDQNGNPFSSKDQLTDQVWIATFIFTRCSGPCPIIAAKVSALQNEYRNLNDLKFVSFSVDPNYDKPPVLKKYAQQFKAQDDRWFFLTGEREKIHGLIRDNFHLAVKEALPEGSDIIHSLHFVLVGREGKIQGYFNSNDPDAVADLKTQIQQLSPVS